jgi:hypothetical protein
MSFSIGIKSLINSNRNAILLCNKRFNSSAQQVYKNIIAEVRGQHKNIGFLQLHRPKALNALNAELMVCIRFSSSFFFFFLII